MVIELYSKPNCSLCEDARAALLGLRARHAFELVERDVRSDPSLWERFRYDVPVVLIDGEVAYRHRVDPEEMERRLTSAGRRPS
jgi:predicted thioredoxin/glutaredoxin